MNRLEKFFLTMFLLAITGIQAQVGVGTRTPNSDAMLEVSATNKGLLLPRIALTASTAASPLGTHVAGMTVYNTATTADVTPGYYYNDGSKWVKLGPGSGATEATTTVNGLIRLAGDLAGTAAAPTVPALSLKVDKETGKGLSSNDYTTAEKTKLGAISGSNTGDQDLSTFATITSLDAKVDKVAGKGLSSNDYTTAEKAILNATSGINTGDQTTITGNAGTATKLAAPKNINGVAFDGTADITVAAAAGTLTGATLASNVLNSSLTSVGTLDNLSVTNTIMGSVSGNAATVTTNANLTGDVTSTGNETTIGANKVLTGMIADANVTTTKITDLNVTEVKLANDAVTSAKIANGTIVAADLATDAVEEVKIKDAAVTSAKIANGTIVAVDIATDAVEEVKIKDAAVTNAKLDKANIPLSGFGAAQVDVALGAKKLTDVADPTNAQDAATKAYADTKASKVEITGVEITLPTKINSKQLYSIAGNLTIVSGTEASIPPIVDLTDYYSIRVFKDGKPFRNEVRFFNAATSPISIVTGNGMMSEIYPSSGTYTYVLEYFKL